MGPPWDMEVSPKQPQPQVPALDPILTVDLSQAETMCSGKTFRVS